MKGWILLIVGGSSALVSLLVWRVGRSNMATLRIYPPSHIDLLSSIRIKLRELEQGAVGLGGGPVRRRRSGPVRRKQQVVVRSFLRWSRLRGGRRSLSKVIDALIRVVIIILVVALGKDIFLAGMPRWFDIISLLAVVLFLFLVVSSLVPATADVLGFLSHHRHRLRKGEARKMAAVFGIPTRLYEDGSCVVVCSLVGWEIVDGKSGRLMVTDKEGNQYVLIDSVMISEPEWLEVELLAPGFEVDGERRQRQEVSANIMYYRWGIRPKRAGIYQLCFSFRVGDEGGRVVDLGDVRYTVKVVKWDGLTLRHLYWFTGLSALVSLISLALGIVSSLIDLELISVP